MSEQPVHSSNVKRALITGVTGQDGSYLAEWLLQQGYEVWGLVRRSSIANTQRLQALTLPNLETARRFHLVLGDLADAGSLHHVVRDTQPDEIYHLAAQSHVKASFDTPEHTGDITGLGTVRLLEATVAHCRSARFYQASSSEMFGLATESPQHEQTPFYPRSPYGAAKAFAHFMVRNYREAYGLFAVNGILFNHESPRRGETFVTRKITLAAARIALGMQDRLQLGNLDAQRDWGFAGDYVRAMWAMLQAEAPDDYVIATGEAHTVREFCELAFAHVDRPITWVGQGIDERGVDQNGRTLVEIDASYFRPTEVETLRGDASKAQRMLGWQPTISFAQLVTMMVDADLALLRTSQT